MLSVKQEGIKYHFFSLLYDSTWDRTPVSWTIGEHSTHLDNTYIHIYERYVQSNFGLKIGYKQYSDMNLKSFLCFLKSPIFTRVDMNCCLNMYIFQKVL